MPITPLMDYHPDVHAAFAAELAASRRSDERILAGVDTAFDGPEPDPTSMAEAVAWLESQLASA